MPSNSLPILFCRQARARIRDRFKHLFANNDAATYRVAQEAMKGTFDWLAQGLIVDDWVPQPDSGAENESPEKASPVESPRQPDSESVREPAGHA